MSTGGYTTRESRPKYVRTRARVIREFDTYWSTRCAAIQSHWRQRRNSVRRTARLTGSREASVTSRSFHA